MKGEPTTETGVADGRRTSVADASGERRLSNSESSDSVPAETNVENESATVGNDEYVGAATRTGADAYRDETVSSRPNSVSTSDAVADELVDKNVLVTGGAGFIGSHLANRLADANEVVVLDDFSTGSADNVDSSVELVEANMTDADRVRELVDGVDILVHMAAMMGVRRTLENPLEVLEVNMEGTKTVLRAAAERDVDRILFTSTSEVYGDLVEPPYGEGDEKSPKTNYAVAKLADERYTKAFCRDAGIDYSIVRYFNVYGPRQESSEYGYVVPRFIERAKNDDPVPVHGDGSQTRDFTYIDDAVEATVRVLGPNGANETFNIGSGTEVSIAELARTVVDTVGSGEIDFIEHPRPYTVERRCADVSKLNDRLGYVPETDLETGVDLLAKQL